jgi:hypothetical protein
MVWEGEGRKKDNKTYGLVLLAIVYQSRLC